MTSFFAKKYALGSTDYAVTEPLVESLYAKHVTDAPAPAPFLTEEIEKALAKVRKNTASGLDSVCYDAIRTFLVSDKKGKLVAFFNDVLFGKCPIPQSWKVGKICFVPKTRKPVKPGDLKPIFTRVLVMRLHSKFPPYGAGQHASRKGTQVLEAVACAQSTVRIFKRFEQRNIHVLKLDIGQAFDTLSHQAIWRFLMSTDQELNPGCSGTCVGRLRSICSSARTLGVRNYIEEHYREPPSVLTFSLVLSTFSSQVWLSHGRRLVMTLSEDLTCHICCYTLMTSYCLEIPPETFRGSCTTYRRFCPQLVCSLTWVNARVYRMKMAQILEFGRWGRLARSAGPLNSCTWEPPFPTTPILWDS